MTPQEKLKALRKERNLTTQQLGDLCGIPQSTISKLENGKRRMDTKIIALLAKGLNVEPREFLDNHWEEQHDISKELQEEKFEDGIKSFKSKVDNSDLNSINKEIIPGNKDITDEFYKLMGKVYSEDEGILFFNDHALDGENMELFENAINRAIIKIKGRNKKNKQKEEDVR